MEPDEGLEKLQIAFRVCGKYREGYEDRRAHLAEYFKEQPVVEWDFEPSLVFARVDRLTSQMKMIEVREGGEEDQRRGEGGRHVEKGRKQRWRRYMYI